MKKIFFGLLLFVSVSSIAQTDSSNVVELNTSFVIQPEIRVSIIGFEITATTDYPIEKKVVANVNLISADGQKYDRSNIILWQGDDYDLIGDWTTDDEINRLKEILKP